MKNVQKILMTLLCVFSFFGCTPIKEETVEGRGDEPVELSHLELPEILSEYALLIDRNNGQILYEKNCEERIYPASMTKLMTAILALESIEDYDETFTFTEEVLEGLEEANANRAGFLVGDSPTLLDLIYGDILPSGADCSRALAFYICGSEEAFVEKMNEKAQELGMDHTHFVNTSGLFEEEHYSTCTDLYILMDYCMNNPMFMEILGTTRHVSIPVKHYPNGLAMDSLVMAYINQIGTGRYGHMFLIPGFLGGKSGYILESNFSMASAVERDGMQMVLITCDARKEGYYPAHVEDAARLYGWAAKSYTPMKVVEPHEFEAELAIARHKSTTVKVRVEDTIEADCGNPATIFIPKENLSAPLGKGEVVGVLQVYSDDIMLAECDVVLAEDVAMDRWNSPKDLLKQILDTQRWVVTLLLGAIAILLIRAILRPAGKRKKTNDKHSA